MKKEKLKLNLYVYGTEMMRESSRDIAEIAFNNRDGVAFAYSAYDDDCMFALVWENSNILIEKGMYEDALFTALSNNKYCNPDWRPQSLLGAIERADIDKIRALGNPIPDGEKFTLYRGVAGPKSMRNVRSIYWTDDFDVAAWFACRFHYLDDPAVYKTTVSRKKIVYFLDERSEREFIVSGLGRINKMNVTHEELLKAKERFRIRKNEEDKKMRERHIRKLKGK
nr:hypothetical protein 11 [Candidatus Hydrogenedentota bacterium]